MKASTLGRALCCMLLFSIFGQVLAQGNEYAIRKALSEPMVLLVSCRDAEVITGQYHKVTYGLVDPAEMMDALGGRETRRDTAMCVSYNVRNAPEDVQRALDLAEELGYGHVLCLMENPPDHVIGVHGRYIAALYKAGKGKKIYGQKPIMLEKTISYKTLAKKVASNLN